MVWQKVQDAINNHTFWQIEYRINTKDGIEKWVWEQGCGVYSNAGELEVLEGFISDISLLRKQDLEITERKREEEELKSSRDQLRNFASHLQRVREKERVLIALEIHDSLAQFLVALKMDIGVFRNKIFKGDDMVKKRDILAVIEKFIKETEYTINSARNIMNGLRPDQLELLGLVDTVEVHLRQFEEIHHLKYKFENNLQNLVIPPEEELVLFRILQESLNNILKHAMATQVNVKLNNNSGNLILEISDNGVGFDIKNCGGADSYGLIDMKELVRMLRGTFDITSKLGEGTTVKVEIPFGKHNT
jgi:signal transduction histidine kinase